ncbi:MAG TPA: GNAT family N-acetyltransferase [Blastocatellia bacterium]|nr:GNAT family N-acetyltransferase [Blastocatellia bacterium]
MIQIRRATESDFDQIWQIFHDVIQTGDTYTNPPNTTKDVAYQKWMDPEASTHVAEDDGVIVGVYMLKPNHPGYGSHVANASYIVSPKSQGRGIGRLLGEHSIEEARKAGYLAMQFNVVVSTNTAAVALWKKLGFQIIGTSPKAFNHRELGLVDTYIMHRFL